jgi:hypothetical protein
MVVLSYFPCQELQSLFTLGNGGRQRFARYLTISEAKIIITVFPEKDL